MAFNTNTDFVINSDYDEAYASIYVISSSLNGTFYLREASTLWKNKLSIVNSSRIVAGVTK